MKRNIGRKIKEGLQDFAVSLCMAAIGLVGGIGAIVLYFCRSQVLRRRRK